MTPRKRALRYDTSRPLLDVYLYGRHVGTLGQDGADVWFRYDDGLADEPDAERWRLSVKLPVTAETYGHNETLVFFDNLLLESDTRDALAALTKHDARDLPGLLGRVGGECAGAVSLWPVATSPPTVETYQPVPLKEMRELFDAHHGAQLTRAQLASQQSMSGVQHKLVVRKSPVIGYELPLHGAPSTHILKRSSGRYDGLAINEWLCLRAFRALDLPAATAEVVGGPDGFLEVERYDRARVSATETRRLHQEDFCQATGRRVSAKYQYAGGPGFADIAETLRRHSVDAAADLRALLRAIVANALLGNMDAHAKNFSLLVTDVGPRLAPFYDVVCTEAYPGLDAVMSMKLGHATDPRRVSREDLARLARDLKVTTRAVTEATVQVLDTLAPILASLLHEAAISYGHAPVLDRIEEVVRPRFAVLAGALDGHPLVSPPAA